MNENYKKLIKEAEDYKKQGRIEKAINIYEKIGKVDDSFVHEAIHLSMRNGLLKKCINIFEKNNRPRIARDLKYSIKNKSNRKHNELLQDYEINSFFNDCYDSSLKKASKKSTNQNNKILNEFYRKINSVKN
ncbi:MAG TPA: hypothetical protein VJ912_04085 [Candidatus Nanoarchaeia archaeon]|nr:hypothetical protein [Candidatus Nanoarchaeia archaeon]